MKNLNVMLLVGVIGFLFVLAPTAKAEVAVSNGSFELYDPCTMPISPLFSAPDGWNLEEITLYEGTQNSTVNIHEFSEIGSDPCDVQIDGDRYLRLVHDHDGTTGWAGGVWQNVGTMVGGETYAFSATAYSRDDFGYCLDYDVAMELYAGSIDPLNLLTRETLTLDSTSGLGVTNTGVLSASALGVDGTDLILRIAMADPSFEASPQRGGIDNVYLVPEPATLALIGLGGIFLSRRKK